MMNSSKPIFSEAVMDRVCDLLCEFSNCNDAAKELHAKYRILADAIRAYIPKDKQYLILEAEEYSVELETLLQEMLYFQGLEDGKSFTDHNISDLSQYPGILKVEDIAKYLRIGRVQAYNLVHRKDFPKIIDGRKIRIPKSAFQKWLDSTAFEN